MSFNSLEYFEFLVCICFLLFLFKKWVNVKVLFLIFSYFFYACWDWRFLFLIVLTSWIDYNCGKFIYRKKDIRVLLVSVIFNFGILFLFKYFNFFQQNLLKTLGHLGFSISPWTLEILLPVGISFYTFQSMSYVVDVYREKAKPVTRFIDYSLYVSFFPQLVAGPIERASRLCPQLDKVSFPTLDRTPSALWLILLGLFKKVVIADNLADLSLGLIHHESTLGLNMLISMYAFSLQVYGDFSGYTDIARGTAKLFGVDLMKNFKSPFFAVNIQEFWGRWHISLSEWVKDYVFYPLMRSRILFNQVSINVFLTMLAIGAWHGAGSKFMIFGAWHGLLLVLFEKTRKLRKKIRPKKGHPWRTTHKRLSQVLTFHLVVVAFSIFGCQYSSDLPLIYGSLFTMESTPDLVPFGVFAYFATLLIAIDLAQNRYGESFISKLSPFFKLTIIGFMFSAIVVHGGIHSNPFIYFQF